MPIENNTNQPTQGEWGSYDMTTGMWTITTNASSDNATWYNTVPLTDELPPGVYYGYSGSDLNGVWGWQTAPVEEKKSLVDRYKRNTVKAGLVNFLEKMEVEGVDSTKKGR